MKSPAGWFDIPQSQPSNVGGIWDRYHCYGMERYANVLPARE